MPHPYSRTDETSAHRATSPAGKELVEHLNWAIADTMVMRARIEVAAAQFLAYNGHRLGAEERAVVPCATGLFEDMGELLADTVAVFAVGAIGLERMALDDMHVRADASAGSFRRPASLEGHLSQTRELVQTINTQTQTDPGQTKRQAQAARLRVAQEREARIRAALEQLTEAAAAYTRSAPPGAKSRPLSESIWTTPAPTWPSWRRLPSTSNSAWVAARTSGWSVASSASQMGVRPQAPAQ